MDQLNDIAARISASRFWDEPKAVTGLLELVSLDGLARDRIAARAADIVEHLRNTSKPGIMELFLAEYGLSTREGIALMTLAEAYLRTPDVKTLDALIADKIGAGDWKNHVAKSGSVLMSASAWTLMLTGRMLQEHEIDTEDLFDSVTAIFRRLGEPVVRKAVDQALRLLGAQFVLGRDISEALKHSMARETEGYTYSYDMLGEAAITQSDAQRYFKAYSQAISAIADRARHRNCHDNPGISVKLSALHPRYEYQKHARVLTELVPIVHALAMQARVSNIGFSIDAEEADRLELSLEVIEAVLSFPGLEGWDGFGVVVQAYFKQAPAVIDWLYELACKLDRRIAVRLVKGAYWDFEIKQGQVSGLENYPVFTRKAHSDVSYLVCAEKLLGMTDRIYPQFATHNAHSASAILELGGAGGGFEFQRLHGMGEPMHQYLRETTNIPCRIYAPVGVHKDLLAYLVRRLIENGANSSFIHKLLDKSVAVSDVVRDPVALTQKRGPSPHPKIPLPPRIYGKARLNSRGIDVNNPLQAHVLDVALAKFKSRTWHYKSKGDLVHITNPADHDDCVGSICQASSSDVGPALDVAETAYPRWVNMPVNERAEILERIADLLTENMTELIAIAIREAGKTRNDGILEVREAVDFCRYYAAEARILFSRNDRVGVGPVVCISPWNFPLAIFVGQIAAALVCGNTVIAKPAEQTPLMASYAVHLMHQAGVPEDVLLLLCGEGATVGTALTSDVRVKGVCFTGSTQSAQLIDRALGEHGDPQAFLIAETGGLNAMIVDSSALPEQAVRDIITSAFQSAGQRCSALRLLLVQKDVEAQILELLEGAASELSIGDPWCASTDIGPVIDLEAQRVILDHCRKMEAAGRILFQVPVLDDVKAKGQYVGPTAVRLDRFDDLTGEIFGPVLHILPFEADDLDRIVDLINGSGYGLTLGIHSRVDTRINQICNKARVGNIYVNRNQIGAVVGVQPFGGQGLSGTGPKAGGPLYLHRFTRAQNEMPSRVIMPSSSDMIVAPGAQITADLDKSITRAHFAQVSWDLSPDRPAILEEFANQLPSSLRKAAKGALKQVNDAMARQTDLRGPTGEQNIYSLHGRGIILCLGGGENSGEQLLHQTLLSLGSGNAVLISTADYQGVVEKIRNAFALTDLPGDLIVVDAGSLASLLTIKELAGVAISGDVEYLRAIRIALSRRPGARITLLTSTSSADGYSTEKLVSTNTTASGGNASLFAATSDTGLGRVTTEHE